VLNLSISYLKTVDREDVTLLLLFLNSFFFACLISSLFGVVDRISFIYLMRRLVLSPVLEEVEIFGYMLNII